MVPEPVAGSWPPAPTAFDVDEDEDEDEDDDELDDVEAVLVSPTASVWSAVRVYGPAGLSDGVQSVLAVSVSVY